MAGSLASKRNFVVLASIALIFLVLALVITIPMVTVPSSKYANNETCTTTECKKAAYLISSSMDSSIDPCTDFYKYVNDFIFCK